VFDQYNQQSPEPNHAGRIIGIVLGCISIGLALVRCNLNSRRYTTPPIDLSSAYSASAYSDYLPTKAFSRLELPGMSLDAPSHQTPTGDYATGAVEGSGVPQYGITWQPGEYPAKADLATIVAGMGSALDRQLQTTSRVVATRELEVGGAPAHQFELSSGVDEDSVRFGYSTMIVTFTSCGGRIIQILVAGRGDTKSTVTKMTDSFVCTPDPTKDATRIGVAVAVKPGWKQASSTPGRLTLVDARRDLFVQPTRLIQTNGALALERYIPDAVRIGGFEVLPGYKTRGDKKVWTGMFTIDGEAHAAALVAWRCPDRSGVGVVYVVSMTPKTKLDRGLELAYTGRCLDASEPAPAYPREVEVKPGKRVIR
jgi:hypothetical protein